ncbi:hypothetical protein KSC_074960 [Ktedonobacter sp. SOSP1-52]|nr:hypothetical protein KSC_074960 [Ktedonobacter sp. SOSP1-52]
MGKRYPGKVAAVVIIQHTTRRKPEKAESDPGIDRKAYNKPAHKATHKEGKMM